MEYNFRAIEEKWQKHWNDTHAYKVSNESSRPKFYVLDMFPYPSGAGLHVGHPLGYIASDIFARFKRLKGFNVLHPMGYDAFGLPAEQYAIEHGIHPAVSTEQNIKNFRSQLDKIGFCYDWSRQVNTSDPAYYKWTQWIFLQLFNSYFNRSKQKAESINVLIESFEKEGNKNHPFPNASYRLPVTGNQQPATSNTFSSEAWKGFDDKTQQNILMEYRLAYCGYGEVNWCEALGTVLANDEVVNGVSERGGYPVVKKKLRQWYLRITEYADRLLEALERIDFSEAMKDMQTNWIGKSQGAEITFNIQHSTSKLVVYTTRPDTIFGVDFMVVAPEHELIEHITTAEQKQVVEEYITYVKSRSDRERQAEKKITGCFTGAYALNSFNGRQIPIWISEYVLAGYGTGAIMAVPCGDERDFKFAQHFNIPITNIIGDAFNGTEANPTKDALLTNSDFLNGMVMRDAMSVVNDKLKELGIGVRKVNYKMRDAAFSRQRYWGEPFPVKWLNGTALALPETELPLELPKVDSYSPGPEGEGPLANIPEWVAKELETNTMPGYAGSSWYFLRYMDPHNSTAFCDRKVSDYWGQVDLYIGGTEHAVGHLLYSRMWTKALYDLGFVGHDEPYKKLVNQGMIQGSSRFLFYAKSVKFDYDKESAFEIYNEGDATIESMDYEVGLQLSNISIKIYFSEDLIEKGNESNLHQEKLQETFLKAIKEKAEAKEGFISKINITNANFEGFLKTSNIDVALVDGYELILEEFFTKNKYFDASIISSNQKIYTKHSHVKEKGDSCICGAEVEKMSKSKFNTVNPDDLVMKYGADTFRMYEMFLGPVEQSKPWDTKGIEGVHRFLKKLWRLFFDELKGAIWTSSSPSPLERVGGEASAAELKVLHKTIQKIESDTERFSFNTAVSAFMVCVNELSDLKCHKKEILEQLLILLVPYAPHITEELWHELSNTGSILDADYPKFEEKYVAESAKEYPVSINGKVRTNINIALDATQEQVQNIVLSNEVIKKWVDDKPVKKFIFVKGKMVNLVI
jgi:leucyl-tRNA synthetase